MYYHFKDKQNVNSQHSKFFQIFCFKEKEENSLMMPSYLAKLKKTKSCTLCKVRTLILIRVLQVILN